MHCHPKIHAIKKGSVDYTSAVYIQVSVGGYLYVANSAQSLPHVCDTCHHCRKTCLRLSDKQSCLDFLAVYCVLA